MRLLVLLLAGCYAPTGVLPDPEDTGSAQDDTAGVDTGDTAAGPVGEVEIRIHDEVETLLVVHWNQAEALEATWVEFSFGDGEGGASLARSRGAGPQEEVILGVPEETEVTLRICWEEDGAVRESGPWVATTGPLPPSLAVPEAVEWDPERSSPEGWLLTTLDTSGWYGGPWWVIVLDRQGRVVWYRKVPENRTTMFPRVARDGTHLIHEESTWYAYGTTSPPCIRRLTLDLAWEETLEVAGLGYSWDELDDGSFLVDWWTDRDVGLAEVRADGSREDVWSCSRWASWGGGTWACATNTVNWNPASDTVFWSMFESDTVVEVDRATGEVLRDWGRHGSWSFDPLESAFDLQHFPNYTADGHLMISTHLPGGRPQQRAWEYEVDDEARTLRAVWSYGEGVDEYATYAGEATRLENGNTLINYGTGGALREVTPEGEVAWRVEWQGNKLLGHMVLIDDLYAINRGPGAASP